MATLTNRPPASTSPGVTSFATAASSTFHATPCVRRCRRSSRRTAASFRPLTASERRAIRETRLRIARARQGKTIGDVVRRTGSAWSAEEAAVANEVAPGDVLGGGRPVKVAMTEPYVAGY